LGSTWGLLDYLTDELWVAFKRGAQVWDSEKNHRAQRQLVMDAIARAKLRYKLAEDDCKKIGGG